MRKIDPEAAAFAGFRFDANAAAHAFNTFAHDGEADTGAVVASTVEPFEDAENALFILRGNADAVVFDPNAGGTVLDFGADADVRNFAFFDEFEGVAEEIGTDLSEDGFLGEDGWERFFDDHFPSGVLDDAFALSEGVFPDAFECDGAEGDFGPRHAAVGEKVEGHGIHLFGGNHDALGILAAFFLK